MMYTIALKMNSNLAKKKFWFQLYPTEKKEMKTLIFARLLNAMWKSKIEHLLYWNIWHIQEVSDFTIIFCHLNIISCFVPLTCFSIAKSNFDKDVKEIR